MKMPSPVGTPDTQGPAFHPLALPLPRGYEEERFHRYEVRIVVSMLERP